MKPAPAARFFLLALPLLAFVTGFSATWSWLPRAGSDEDISSRGASVSKREEQAYPSGRYQDFYHPSGGGGMYYSLDRMREAGLSASEMGDFIMSLMRRYQSDARYFDDYELPVYASLEWSVMKEAFRAMYEKDPAAAIEWVMALEHTGDQRPFLCEALELETGRDLDAALALMEKVAERTGEPLEVTGGLMDKGISQGAESFLRVVAAGMRENGAINPEAYWAPEYPADFDFKTALDGITALDRNAPEGHGLSAVPDDLLRQWLKRDPEAATQWFLAGNRAPENGVAGFFTQYSETATSQEVGALASKLLGSGAAGPANYAETWEALSLFEDRDVVVGFFATDAVRPQAAEHAGGLLRASMDEEIYGFTAQERAMAVRENLLSLLDENQRREFFQKEASSIAESETLRNRYASMLGSLGHSAAEIAEMLPPSKTN